MYFVLHLQLFGVLQLCVGLYRCPYIEACKNVMISLRQRGWKVIADRPVFRVLLFC